MVLLEPPLWSADHPNSYQPTETEDAAPVDKAVFYAVTWMKLLQPRKCEGLLLLFFQAKEATGFKDSGSWSSGFC